MMFSIVLSAGLLGNPGFQCWNDLYRGREDVGLESIQRRAVTDYEHKTLSNLESYLMTEFMRAYLTYKSELNEGEFNRNGSIEKHFQKIDQTVRSAINVSMLD